MLCTIQYKTRGKEGSCSMNKIWIVLLFLCVFLLLSSIVKRFAIRFINSAESQSSYSPTIAEKEDPRVFWNEEGKRREPENAEYELPEEDFFETEKTEFPETFEESFFGLSEDEKEKILSEAGLFEEEGDDR